MENVSAVVENTGIGINKPRGTEPGISWWGTLYTLDSEAGVFCNMRLIMREL